MCKVSFNKNRRNKVFRIRYSANRHLQSKEDGSDDSVGPMHLCRNEHRCKSVEIDSIEFESQPNVPNVMQRGG